MRSMEMIDYLKDPALVAKVQKYFGVKLKENDKSDDCKESGRTKFEIANRFWYYVFLLGTGLGDELFYSCFIPFWFWNIDGFVGRRFVLVWTIIMYIG